MLDGRFIVGKTLAALFLAFASLILFSTQALAGTSNPDDDLVFIHHSCGNNWLASGLDSALTAKNYIDERNDIYYGTDLPPDAGRPDSLASIPGDHTDMCHWVYWFNDYLEGVKTHGCANGQNRIILYKSCYPISNVSEDGTEPGDPFSGTQSLANYRAVYRHFNGAGNTYTANGYAYHPLEDIFAANPDTLFIVVTAPPRHYAPVDATTDADAHRARSFNDWLKNDWLAGCNTAHPGLNNVAVYDWFNFLAYPDDHATHPNRLRQEYGGDGGDSHPNTAANQASTLDYATGSANFIDAAWAAFMGTPFTLTFTPTVSSTPTVTPIVSPTLPPTVTPTVTATRTATPMGMAPDATATSTLDSGDGAIRAFPNPARGRVRFSLNLEQAGGVRISLYNLAGERVAELGDTLAAGPGELTWECGSVPPGIYLVRIQVNGKETKQLQVAVVK